MNLVTRQTGSEADEVSLLVHGGAWNIPDEEIADHEEGLKNAIEVGKSALKDKKGAMDIATLVVSTMESSGIFDAGRGSVLNREGYVELDAGIMCGATKRWGAVSGVTSFENPIQIAREIAHVGDMQFCFLGAAHAEEFARVRGMKEVPKESLICMREKNRYEALLASSKTFHTSHPFLPDDRDAPVGTVGCVVRDHEGRLAAATSTGGTPFRLAGRIGDSPLPGCGYFSNERGAASATGWGEAIASVALCKEAVTCLEYGFNVKEAVDKALTNLFNAVKNTEGYGATGGLILIDASGNAAWGFTTPKMARASLQKNGDHLVFVT